jgi:hypothetical protein
MKTSLRARATRRTVADQRLSDLTLATAVAGLAATIGFGGLAAVTYAGTASTPIVTGAGQDSVTAPRTQGGSNPTTTNGGGSTTTRPNTTQNGGSSSNGSSSGGVSRSNGRAHVSTGSS